MGRLEAIASLYPKTDVVARYVRPMVFPPLDMGQMVLSCMMGSDRSVLKTPTAGDLSLMLSYKAKEGAVSSFSVQDRDLTLAQLQGARSPRSFRVTTSIYWIDLMADEAVAIAKHRRAGIRRLLMPKPAMIEGIEHAVSEQVVIRYHDFATRAGLRWSDQDVAFARDF